MENNMNNKKLKKNSNNNFCIGYIIRSYSWNCKLG